MLYKINKSEYLNKIDCWYILHTENGNNNVNTNIIKNETQNIKHIIQTCAFIYYSFNID